MRTDPTPDPAMPPLAGRRSELAALRAAIAVPDGPPLIELSGDPGIGKTRLLAEVTALASARHSAVLTGQAAQFGHEVPFGLLAEALADPLARLGERARGRLGADAAALLSSAFAVHGGPGGGHPAGDIVGMDRYRLCRAVRALLEICAGPGGITIALDDAHWADDGSAELLGYLLRHPPRVPCLFAVAYRPRQASPRLLAALGRAPGSVRLELEPLDLPGVTELLGGGVGSTRVRELFEASGGNPFYLAALARAAGGPRQPVAAELMPGISGPVRAALSAELGLLPPRALLLAQAAAVAGDPFDPELLAVVAGLGLDETAAALDELAAHDLVRAEPQGRGFRYRHPIVRGAAYQLAPAAWRLGAHARAAQVLAGRGASAMARAHHVERAAEPGDAAAIATLGEAAEEAFHTVPTLAGHWLSAAIALLPDTPEGAAQRTGLLLRKARALIVTGAFAECRDLLHEVLRLLPDPGHPLRGIAVAMCGAADRLRGRYAEAHALLVAELDRLPENSGPAASVLRIDIASGEIQCARFAEAAEWAQAARDGSLTPLWQACVAGILATAFTYTGRLAEAAAELRTAQRLLDGLPDGDLAYRLSLTLEIAWAEMVMERYDDAIRHIRRGMALASRIGQGHMHADLLAALATCHTLQGRLAEAADCAEATYEHVLMLGRKPMHEASLAGRSEIALLSGDTGAAVALATEAVAAALPLQFWGTGLGTVTLAAARLGAGDPRGCLEAFAEFADPGTAASAGALRRLWHPELVEASLAAGDPVAALEWARHGEKTAAGDLPVRSGQAGIALSCALLANGDADGAAAAARTAVEAFARARLPIWEGRARAALGGALAGQGAAEAAAVQYGRAKGLFAASGARALHAAVVDQQRTLGARQPRARTGQPGALTARQREIAELVGQGLTNRQVAERLFMSPKTVDAHLSQVFSRLGISTRAALASRLAALDASLDTGPDPGAGD